MNPKIKKQRGTKRKLKALLRNIDSSSHSYGHTKGSNISMCPAEILSTVPVPKEISKGNLSRNSGCRKTVP